MELIVHAQVYAVIERELGGELSALACDALARRLCEHVAALAFEPGAFLLSGGAAAEGVALFLGVGSAELIVNGLVVRKLHAPCLLTSASAPAAAERDDGLPGAALSDDADAELDAALREELAAGGVTTAHADVRACGACSAYAVPITSFAGAIRADVLALRAWRVRAARACVSELFPSLLDNLSYYDAGPVAEPSLADALWAALRFTLVPVHGVLASYKSTSAAISSAASGDPPVAAVSPNAAADAATARRRAAHRRSDAAEAVLLDESAIHVLARGRARLCRHALAPRAILAPAPGAAAPTCSPEPRSGRGCGLSGCGGADIERIGAPYLLAHRALVSSSADTPLLAVRLVAESRCVVATLPLAAFDSLGQTFPQLPERLRRAAERQHADSAVRALPARLLSRFVPSVVLQRLSRPPALRVHEVTRFAACVGFVDISGFTKLSMLLREAMGERLGAESLNRIVNGYMTPLLAAIQRSGGDTIKFAGDAILVVWGANQQDDWAGSEYASNSGAAAVGVEAGVSSGGSSARSQRPLHELLSDAIGCCAELVTRYNNYAIEVESELGDAGLLIDAPDGDADGQSAQAARALEIQAELCAHTLKLHCGLGCGEVSAFFVGGYNGAWEYVIAGAPIDTMSDAANEAQSGELFIASECVALLHNSAPPGALDLGRGAPPAEVDGGLYAADGRLARTSFLVARWLPPAGWAAPLPLPMVDAGLVVSEALEGPLSSFILPFVTRRVLSGQTSAWMCEFRMGTMLFVKIDGLDFAAPAREIADELQRVVCTVQMFVARFDGHVLRLIVDDKGTRFKIAFGLSAHVDDAARAVTMACQLQAHLRQLTDNKISCAIGLTSGYTFLGDVGSDSRCEYTSTGAHVNTAARLMSSAAARPLEAGRLLCDEETRKQVGDVSLLSFTPQPRLTLKGIDEPLPNYAPSVREGVDRALVAETHAQSQLVGQDALLQGLLAHVRVPGRIALLTGIHGSGKSALLREACARAQTSSCRSLYLQLDAHSSTTPLALWQAVFARLLEADAAAPLRRDLRALADVRTSEQLFATLELLGGGDIGSGGGGASGERGRGRRGGRGAHGAGAVVAAVAEQTAAVARASLEVRRASATGSVATPRGRKRGSVAIPAIAASRSSAGPAGWQLSLVIPLFSALRTSTASGSRAPSAAATDGADDNSAGGRRPNSRPAGTRIPAIAASQSAYRLPTVSIGRLPLGGGGGGALAAPASVRVGRRWMVSRVSVAPASPPRVGSIDETGDASTGASASAGASAGAGACACTCASASAGVSAGATAGATADATAGVTAGASVGGDVDAGVDYALRAAAAGATGRGLNSADALQPVACGQAATGLTLAMEPRRRQLVQPPPDRARGQGMRWRSIGALRSPADALYTPDALPVIEGSKTAGAASVESRWRSPTFRRRRHISALNATTAAGAASAHAAGAESRSLSAKQLTSPQHQPRAFDDDGDDVRVSASRSGPLSTGPAAAAIPSVEPLVLESALLREQPGLIAALSLLNPLLVRAGVQLPPLGALGALEPGFERFADTATSLLRGLIDLLGGGSGGNVADGADGGADRAAASTVRAPIDLLLLGVDGALHVDLLSWRLAAHFETSGVPLSIIAAEPAASAQQTRWLKQLGLKPRIEHFAIGPLSVADSVTLFKARLGIAHELPAAVESTVVLRAQGAPNILCELARYLLDTGHVLQADGSSLASATPAKGRGDLHLSFSINLAGLRALPTVEHKLLRAQIDRMPPSEQRLLKTCAVIGEVFSLVDVAEMQALEVQAGLVSDAELPDAPGPRSKPAAAGAAAGERGGDGGGEAGRAALDHFGAYSTLLALERREIVSLRDASALQFAFVKHSIREEVIRSITEKQASQLHAVAAGWLRARRDSASDAKRTLDEMLESGVHTAAQGRQIVRLAALSASFGRAEYVRLAKHCERAHQPLGAAAAWHAAARVALLASNFEEAHVLIGAGLGVALRAGAAENALPSGASMPRSQRTMGSSRGANTLAAPPTLPKAEGCGGGGGGGKDSERSGEGGGGRSAGARALCARMRAVFELSRENLLRLSAARSVRARDNDDDGAGALGPIDMSGSPVTARHDDKAIVSLWLAGSLRLQLGIALFHIGLHEDAVSTLAEFTEPKRWLPPSAPALGEHNSGSGETASTRAEAPPTAEPGAQVATPGGAEHDDMSLLARTASIVIEASRRELALLGAARVGPLLGRPRTLSGAIGARRAGATPAALALSGVDGIDKLQEASERNNQTLARSTSSRLQRQRVPDSPLVPLRRGSGSVRFSAAGASTLGLSRSRACSTEHGSGATTSAPSVITCSPPSTPVAYPSPALIASSAERCEPRAPDSQCARFCAYVVSSGELLRSLATPVPLLAKAAARAAVVRAGGHARVAPLDVDAPLVRGAIALVFCAAASLGLPASAAPIDERLLALRARALLALVDESDGASALAPLVACLAPHAGLVAFSPRERLADYEQLAAGLHDRSVDSALARGCDGGGPAAAAARPASAPARLPSQAQGRAGAIAEGAEGVSSPALVGALVRLLRPCSLHLFGLACARVGDVGGVRVYAEAAIQEAIVAKSLHVVRAASLSLATVLFFQGELREAGHLFLFVRGLAADASDAAAERQMRAYAALCTALLARSAAAVVAGDVDVEAADDPAASPAQPRSPGGGAESHGGGGSAAVDPTDRLAIAISLAAQAGVRPVHAWVLLQTRLEAAHTDPLAADAPSAHAVEEAARLLAADAAADAADATNGARAGWLDSISLHCRCHAALAIARARATTAAAARAARAADAPALSAAAGGALAYAELAIADASALGGATLVLAPWACALEGALALLRGQRGRALARARDALKTVGGHDDAQALRYVRADALWRYGSLLRRGAEDAAAACVSAAADEFRALALLADARPAERWLTARGRDAGGERLVRPPRWPLGRAAAAAPVGVDALDDDDDDDALLAAIGADVDALLKHSGVATHGRYCSPRRKRFARTAAPPPATPTASRPADGGARAPAALAATPSVSVDALPFALDPTSATSAPQHPFGRFAMRIMRRGTAPPAPGSPTPPRATSDELPDADSLSQSFQVPPGARTSPGTRMLSSYAARATLRAHAAAHEPRSLSGDSAHASRAGLLRVAPSPGARMLRALSGDNAHASRAGLLRVAPSPSARTLPPLTARATWRAHGAADKPRSHSGDNARARRAGLLRLASDGADDAATRAAQGGASPRSKSARSHGGGGGSSSWVYRDRMRVLSDARRADVSQADVDAYVEGADRARRLANPGTLGDIHSLVRNLRTQEDGEQ